MAMKEGSDNYTMLECVVAAILTTKVGEGGVSADGAINIYRNMLYLLRKRGGVIDPENEDT